MKKFNSLKDWECVSMEGPLPIRQETLDSISTQKMQRELNI